jgi:hypothetical protein
MNVMKKLTQSYNMNYETPVIEVVTIEIEKGFAGSNIENPEIGEETEW